MAERDPQIEDQECHRCTCNECRANDRNTSQLMLEVAHLRMRLDAVARLASFVGEKTFGEPVSVLLVASDGLAGWKRFSSEGVALRGDPDGPRSFLGLSKAPNLAELLPALRDSDG